jgi:predicted nucleic acid-binding Zn ribbon protein
MDEEEFLRRLTRKAAAIREARKPRLLGHLVGEYMAARVEPQHDRFESVAIAWKEVVPQGLAGFCRLADVARGKARIVVSSPSYLHQLRLQGPDLLAKLQQRAGRGKVKDIKFEIGR